MVITSASNEQIKNIIQLKKKAKVRKQTGCFVVEGIKMFAEIPKEDFVSAYASETFVTEHEELCSGFNAHIVSDSVYKKISDTVTPQGILAIVKQKETTVDEIISDRNRRALKDDCNKDRTIMGRDCKKDQRMPGRQFANIDDKSCIIVLERLQDPGNLGTIIRTGEGAGISGIIMSRDCVDIYSPKVIRSTMGSIFRVPFAVTDDLPLAVQKIKEAGITTYAAHLKGNDLSSEKLAKDCAFLIGNESKGLSDEIASLADKLIKIPMEGQVESLNASVAASILMYVHKMM